MRSPFGRAAAQSPLDWGSLTGKIKRGAPLPESCHDERDLLVLEFQRVARRLAQVDRFRVMAPLDSYAEFNRHHEAVAPAGRELLRLLSQILPSIDVGTLVERRDYRRRSAAATDADS